MKSMFRTITTAALGVICFAGTALATPAVSFTGTTVDWNDGNNYSLGWSFTANHDLSVRSLGVYAAPEYGTGNRVFTQDHAVGIFDMNKNLIASSTVTNADLLSGFFRFHELAAPVQLTGGATYFIAAAMGGDQYTWDTTGFATSPDITYGGSFYSASNTLAFPASADDMTGMANGTFGPNMDVSAVPEPGTVILVGAGLGLLCLVRRKRA